MISVLNCSARSTIRLYIKVVSLTDLTMSFRPGGCHYGSSRITRSQCCTCAQITHPLHPQPPKPAKKDWRKQHEEFIRNIRAAKKAQEHLARGGKLEDLPPPPPMDTSDYVQCPHCSRRFNEAAADRHIPKCASISSNKSKPGTGRSSAAAARKPAPRSSAASRLRR